MSAKAKSQAQPKKPAKPTVHKKPAPKATRKQPANPRPPANAASIDDYLAPLSPDQRAALQRVREIIRTAAPDAVECISYGLPTLKLNGQGLMWFGAAAHHCAVYGAVASNEELQNYDTSGKGTIRFTPEKPLPAAFIRKLVKARRAKMVAKKKRSLRSRQG